MFCGNLFACSSGAGVKNNPHHIRWFTASRRHTDRRHSCNSGIELVVAGFGIGAEFGKTERIEKMMSLSSHGRGGALKCAVTQSIVWPVGFIVMSAWRGPSSMSKLALMSSICFFSIARQRSRL